MFNLETMLNKNHYPTCSTGQSLMELILAMAIGVVLVGAAIVIIAPALKIDTTTNQVKVGSALGRELVEDLRVFAESDWHNIDTLATGTANPYYLATTTTGAFFSTPGVQSVRVGTTTFTRYFYLTDVCREVGVSTDYVTSTLLCVFPLKADPGTKEATVVFQWPQSATNTFSTYFTRFKNRNYSQTDWSQGPNQYTPGSSSFQGFGTSSNLDYSSTTGSFRIILEANP
ncbi:MAG: hypothetical protein HY093_03530 [Candidatus Liptonbacteria bacterium]|nr:hypothetical protein [Candidatus Liptonbacteria bacterium]